MSNTTTASRLATAVDRADYRTLRARVVELTGVTKALFDAHCADLVNWSRACDSSRDGWTDAQCFVAEARTALFRANAGTFKVSQQASAWAVELANNNGKYAS